MFVRELFIKLGFNVDTNKLKTLDSTLNKTKSNIKDVSTSIDTMKKSLETSISSPKRFFVDDRYVELFKEQAAAAKEAAKEFNQALSQFSNLANKTKYSIIGLIGTFTGLTGLSVSVAKDITALDDLAKQIGMTAKDLQELDLVAQQSGLEVGYLAKSFTKLNNDINKVNFSSTLTAKEITKLGVSVYNTNGKLRDSKDIYYEVAKKINRIDDVSKQAAISQKIFGTSNLALVNTLSLTGEEYAKQKAEILKISYVVDSKGIKSTQNFNKSWSQFKIIISGVKQELSVKFMPIFTDMVNKFKEWYGDNRQLISSGIDVFIKSISKAFNLLTNTVDLLLIPIKAVVNLFGGFENTVQILGVTIGISLIPKLLTLITTFKALTVAVLANPIGLATAAFTALGAAIALVYNDINAWISGNKSLIGYLVDEWKIFEKVLNGVSNTLKSIAKIFDKIQAVVSLPKIFDLGGLIDPTGVLRKQREFEESELNSNRKLEPISTRPYNPYEDDDEYSEDVIDIDALRKNGKSTSSNQNIDILTNKGMSSFYMNPTTSPSLNDNRVIKNTVTQTINEVNITVPVGTTQEQASAINQQVVDSIQEQLSQFTLRGMDALGNR
jgi:hypothetical protein